jgi:hypothetical protein
MFRKTSRGQKRWSEKARDVIVPVGSGLSQPPGIRKTNPGARTERVPATETQFLALSYSRRPASDMVGRRGTDAFRSQKGTHDRVDRTMIHSNYTKSDQNNCTYLVRPRNADWLHRAPRRRPAWQPSGPLQPAVAARLQREIELELGQGLDTADGDVSHASVARPRKSATLRRRPLPKGRHRHVQRREPERRRLSSLQFQRLPNRKRRAELEACDRWAVQGKRIRVLQKATLPKPES